MQIVALEAIPIRIPLVRTLKMAVATVAHRDSVVVKLHTDEGLVGVGEAVLVKVGVLNPELSGSAGEQAAAASTAIRANISSL